jgi:hypothetical protein
MQETSEHTVQSPEISEESIVVKRYAVNCSCGRVLHHRDRLTLERNLDRHLQRYHGSDNEGRLKLAMVEKKIRQLRNRLYGR